MNGLKKSGAVNGSVSDETGFLDRHRKGIEHGPCPARRGMPPYMMDGSGMAPIVMEHFTEFHSQCFAGAPGNAMTRERTANTEDSCMKESFTDQAKELFDRWTPEVSRA